MSVTGFADSNSRTPDALARERRTKNLANIAITVLSLYALVAVAQYVIERGYVRRDIVALEEGEAWRTGGWLSQMVLGAVSYLPGLETQQVFLALFASVGMGLVFGLLYQRLRSVGWSMAGATAVLVLLWGNALVLYVDSGSSRGMPVFLSLAVLIPSIRAIEKVGDVQSTISLGLLMPLLLLAGPTTTPLILPFAIASALSDPDGRSDVRAFLAMLLVAILPSLIVAAAVVGFAAQTGTGWLSVVQPYQNAYSTAGLGDWREGLGLLLVLSPIMVLPLIYCFLPGERLRWSAVAVVALPLYVAVGRVVFPWPTPVWAPAMALLATFASWLAVAPLGVRMRAVSVVLLAAAAFASWAVAPEWAEPAWLAALPDVPFIPALR